MSAKRSEALLTLTLKTIVSIALIAKMRWILRTCNQNLSPYDPTLNRQKAANLQLEKEKKKDPSLEKAFLEREGREASGA